MKDEFLKGVANVASFAASICVGAVTKNVIGKNLSPVTGKIANYTLMAGTYVISWVASSVAAKMIEKELEDAIIEMPDEEETKEESPTEEK